MQDVNSLSSYLFMNKRNNQNDELQTQTWTLCID